MEISTARPNQRWTVREGAPNDLADRGYRRQAKHAVQTEDSDDELFLIGEQIAGLAARVNTAEYEMLTLIAEFDERKGWETDGFRSCSEWLAWRIGVQPMTARERVRAARALQNLPATSEAMASGELSFSKVRALTRVACAESEGALLDLARAGSAANLERVIRSWKLLDEKDELTLEQRRNKNRHFSIFVDDDGMYVVQGRLIPEVGALLMRAIEATSDQLYRETQELDRNTQNRPRKRGPTSPPDEHITTSETAQRRADAVGLIAELALSRVASTADDVPDRGFSGSRAERYQVMVHVGPETLAGPGVAGVPGGNEATGPVSTAGSREARSEIEDVRVSAETSKRLCCDAAHITVRHGSCGEILNVGRRTRSIPTAIRRALEVRDRGCRYPGCGSRFTDGHHVKHWAHGGETSLRNLILLCARHHTAVHEGGVRLAVDLNGKAAFFAPNGRVLASSPPISRSLKDASRTTSKGQSPRAGRSCLKIGGARLNVRKPGLDVRKPGLDVGRPGLGVGRAHFKRDSWIPFEVEAAALDRLNAVREKLDAGRDGVG